MRKAIAIALLALASLAAFASRGNGGAVRGAAARAGMMARVFADSSYAYVQDGLKAQWDGRENTGRGSFSSSATTWTDLTGNGYDIIGIKTQYASWTGGALYNPTSRQTDAYGLGYLPASSGLMLDTFAPTSGYRTFEFCIIPYEHYVTTFIDFGNLSGYTTKYFISGWQGTARCALHVETASVNDGSLWHMAIVVNSANSTASFYQNGVWLKSASAYRPTTDLPMIIGCANGGSGYDACRVAKYYAIRIYNRALTAAEIAHNYEVDKRRFNLP